MPRPDHARGAQPTDVKRDLHVKHMNQRPGWSVAREERFGPNRRGQARKGLWAIVNVGRTVPFLAGMHSHADVMTLVEQVGFDPEWAGSGWRGASITEKVDFIATWMIQDSLVGEYGQEAKKDILTTSKMADRMRREMLLSPEQMSALVYHNPHLRLVFKEQRDPQHHGPRVGYDEKD